MSQDLQRIKTNVKRSRGTLNNLIEGFDVESFNSDKDVSHYVQQIDSIVGYLMSARKDLIDYSLSTCVECANLDKKLKEELIQKLGDISNLKK